MINSEALTALRSEFKEYLKPFISAQYKDDIHVLRNIIHTEKVVENILILADSLELSESEKNAAEAIALFHDIGRFWLILQDQTEAAKYDHARASIQYLMTNHSFVSLDESIKNNFIEIIQNHHLPEIQKKDNDAVYFFLRLLRDADKLDIWRATTDNVVDSKKRLNLNRELGLSEKPVITESFCRNILEGGLGDRTEVITFSDFLIYQMSWVFDLNFRKSFQLLNQRQYMRYYYDVLPKNDIVIEIYRKIKIHIENQIL
jgi:hypothetical protein